MLDSVPLRVLVSGPPNTRRFHRQRFQGRQDVIMIAEDFQNWNNPGPFWRPVYFTDLLHLPDHFSGFELWTDAFITIGFLLASFGIVYERRFPVGFKIIVRLSSFAYLFAASMSALLFAKVASVFKFCLTSFLSDFLRELTEGAVQCHIS